MPNNSAQTLNSAQKIEKIFEDADKLYLAVMSKLNIDPEDDFYWNLVLGTLQRQAKDHMIFSIWNNLDKAQTSHLKDYLNQTAVTMPWLSADDALIEFALMYPHLMRKVHESLTEFLKEFVERFNGGRL